MVVVFVALIDEGVDVWRPVPATPLGGARYRLGRPRDFDPQTETWEFPPGAVVECETRTLSGGPALVAIRLTVG
jgi:hypothetical protein